MSEIKVEVELGQFALKLVGSSDAVIGLFRELRDVGLGELASAVSAVPDEESNIVDACETHLIHQEAVSQSADKGFDDAQVIIELPPFETVVMQGRPKSQSEWVLISAVYAAANSTQPINDQAIKEYLAKAKHLDASAKKNYASNIRSLVKKGEIEALTGKEYVVTELGREEARKIIKRPERVPPSRKKPAKAKGTAYQMVDLGLSEDQRNAFRSYWGSMEYPSVVDKALAIAGWLKETLDIVEIKENHVFTMLRIAEENTSFNLLAALTNGKSRFGYYTTGTHPNTFAITHIGEDHLRKLSKHK